MNVSGALGSATGTSRRGGPSANVRVASSCRTARTEILIDGFMTFGCGGISRYSPGTSLKATASRFRPWFMGESSKLKLALSQGSCMARTTIAIGALAKRSGIAASALRFYEAQGLITSTRSAGGRRVFTRDVLRRVAFIRVAQSVGLSLEDIRAALTRLPDQRTPTRVDWERLSSAWRPILDRRID